MAQASAADRGDEPSSNSAIASIRREARASWVRAAAARKSASVRSKRVIATVIAIPLLSQERRITPYRVAPIHLRVSGPGDWYQMGPTANDRRLVAMETLVADAKAKGARMTAGGARIGNRGCLFPLTVLADVPDDARAMREEPFGPLALLSRVRNIDEAIEKGELGAVRAGRVCLYQLGPLRGSAGR